MVQVVGAMGINLSHNADTCISLVSDARVSHVPSVRLYNVQWHCGHTKRMPATPACMAMM